MRTRIASSEFVVISLYADACINRNRKARGARTRRGCCRRHRQVQFALGHHSPAFTLATYGHLLPDDLPDPTFMDALVRAPAAPVVGGYSKLAAAQKDRDPAGAPFSAIAVTNAET
jgi:hypothetical protein